MLIWEWAGLRRWAGLLRQTEAGARWLVVVCAGLKRRLRSADLKILGGRVTCETRAWGDAATEEAHNETGELRQETMRENGDCGVLISSDEAQSRLPADDVLGRPSS